MGCISLHPSSTTAFCEAGVQDSGAATFTSSLDGTTTCFTAVPGPLTMWGQPVTVAYQQADLHLFTTSSSSISTAAAPRHTSATVSATSFSIPMTTNSSSTIFPSANSSHDRSLSAGAIAGIAIGAAALLGILLGAAILLRRRRPNRSVANVEPWPDNRPLEQPVYPGERRDPYDATYHQEPKEMEGSMNMMQELPEKGENTRYEML
jgi:hypothetical protein